MKTNSKVWIKASIVAIFSLFLATGFAQDYEIIKDTQEPTETTIKKDTVTDIDGTVYTTVTIGTQVWMAENLKTTKYNDGTKIPNVTDDDEWENLSSAAYCWYDNDINNGNTYGALYNWYAINTGKLCPAGWHVSTDEEWTELENYLTDNGYNYDGSTGGGRLNIGKALVNDSGWVRIIAEGAVGNTDYPEYRNKSGFAALPGGGRGSDGIFDTIDYFGNWWSATEFNTNDAWYRYMYYSNSHVNRSYYYSKNHGFSVRCVRD